MSSLSEELTYQETVHKHLLANARLKGKNIHIPNAIDAFKDSFIRLIREMIPKENIRIELKQCTRDRVFEMSHAIKNRFLHIPLDVFFYPYTIEPTTAEIRVLEDDIDILIIFKTGYFGNFYFIAGGTLEGHKTTVEKDKWYPTDTFRHTITCDMADDKKHSDANIFYLARIEPYICANCGLHSPNMKKCEGCWSHLKMCVRYCSKACQKEHYTIGLHQIVCGKNNKEQREIRDKEFNDRSEADRALTLLSFENETRIRG